MFADDENVLHCIVSSGHLCRLDTALQSIDGVQELSYFLIEDDMERIINIVKF